MRGKVLELWPEIRWIENEELRDKVTDCWEYALKNSPLSPDDLRVIPFSLLVEDCGVSFMNHKRTTVQLAVKMAEIMKENFGNEIEIEPDILIAGAILIDVGKLFEYEIIDGELTHSSRGKAVRHPFSGVAIADRFGIPPEVQHIIATHSLEGDLGKRSVESIIVHHADFVIFEPFKK